MDSEALCPERQRSSDKQLNQWLQLLLQALNLEPRPSKPEHANAKNQGIKVKFPLPTTQQMFPGIVDRLAVIGHGTKQQNVLGIIET
jgi:hypothetical protein